MYVCLPVFVYFSTSALSHAASLGKLPSHQLCYSPQPSLCTADNARRRRDSSWDEASPLIPPTFPPSFLASLSFSLPVYQLSVCVPGFLALTGWLERHSGTVAPGPKQGLMSEDTLFSLSPFPDGYHLPVCGHISVYLSLEMPTGCLKRRIVYIVRSCKDTFTTFVSFFLEPENTQEISFSFEEASSLRWSHCYTPTLMFKVKQELFCV